jgi:uncharacterized membrane protein YbhN (UPF0104 family)
MTKRVFRLIVQYGIFLGLGVLLVWWQAGKVTPEEKEQIMASLGQVRDRAWLLVPVFFIGFLSHIFRALRWKVMLEPLGIRPSSVNITGAVLIGYLANLLLPRMGEIVRCTVLAKYERQPADRIIGTIVAERSFDMLCLLVIIVLAFILQTDIVSDYFDREMSAYLSKGPALAVAAVGGLLLLLALVIVYRKTRHTKIGQFIAGMMDGIKAILRMKKSGQFLLHTFLIWLCYLLQIYVGFKSIVATEALTMLAALSVLIFGSIGMIVTPGGLGAYPIAVQKILTLYHIEDAYGFAFGWVAWSAQTGTLLILGLIAFLILPAYNRNRYGPDRMDRT